MKKRILCLAVTLCLLVGLLPVTALAAQPNGRFYYLDYGGNSRVGGAYVTMSEGMNPVYLVNRVLTAEEITAANDSQTSSKAIYTRKTTEIPADNYIKLEYPTGGVPTVTLHNVYVNNSFGLAVGWYKVSNTTNAGYVTTTSYSIVLEGSNTIENTGNSYSAFKANTTGNVTITGSGSLTLSCNMTSDTYGVLSTLGDLTFDNTTVNVICPEDYGKSNGITTDCGSVTVKGGSLTVTGIDDPNTTHAAVATSGGRRNAEAMYSAIRLRKADIALTTSDTTALGGDLTIQDGAKVTLLGSPYKTDLVKIDGTFTIKDSDVEIGLAGKLNSSTLLNTAPTFAYTNGYNAIASTTACSYASATATTTAPAKTDPYAEADVATYKYFKVEAVKAPPAFDAVQVVAGNDLALNYRISKAEIDAAGGTQVKIERLTANGEAEPAFVPLIETMVEDGYYVIPFTGIAAKEMGDEISMTVCNAAGEAVSVTRQDSILQYALRMLEGDDAKLKTLIVDMLAYGAMAQEVFGYNQENLASAALTDEQKALGTQQMAACAPNKATVTAAEGFTADVYQGTSFILNHDIAMAMRMSAELGDGSYAKVTFTNYLNEVQEEVTVDAQKLTDGTYAYIYNGLVAADGRCMVTWKFYKADNTEVATVTDSMEQYVGRNVAALPYLAQLMNYSDSAYAYFTA